MAEEAKKVLWPNQMPVVEGVQETLQDPDKFNDDVEPEED